MKDQYELDTDAAIAHEERWRAMESRYITEKREKQQREAAELIALRSEVAALKQHLAEALGHFKDALRPLFDSQPPDWNRLRRYFAWAKRAAHPGMPWPNESPLTSKGEE